jgi:hypothetical protein
MFSSGPDPADGGAPVAAIVAAAIPRLLLPGFIRCSHGRVRMAGHSKRRETRHNHVIARLRKVRTGGYGRAERPALPWSFDDFSRKVSRSDARRTFIQNSDLASSCP